jgi:hypothetical protein
MNSIQPVENDYSSFSIYKEWKYKQSTKNEKSWCLVAPNGIQRLKFFDDEQALKNWVDEQ